MKNKKKLKIKRILILVMVTFLLTGCTTTLVDNKKQAVKNPETGQSLTKNILCQPENTKTVKIYEKNKVNVEKLPKLDDTTDSMAAAICHAHSARFSEKL